MSRDVAWAAMQRVREARSLDAFISELQAEVSELGDEIGDEIAEVGGELDARATALAGERRRALEERARPRVRVKVGVRFRFRVGLGVGVRVRVRVRVSRRSALRSRCCSSSLDASSCSRRLAAKTWG